MKSLLKDILLFVLIIYAGTLTVEKIYGMGREDGVQVGYGAGIQQGFKDGKREACMIKPI